MQVEKDLPLVQFTCALYVGAPLAELTVQTQAMRKRLEGMKLYVAGQIVGDKELV